MASTMANLQAAFNGESNARAKYLAFAQKAAAEGYAGVAKLFEAAAQAEEVHAKSHAAVIAKMGGVAQADIKAAAVGSTRENLADAIKGETYERDVMYPEFITVAKAEGAAGAVRTFEWALAAEAEHAKLYTKALQELEQWKATREFVVCPVCGFTTEGPGPEKCPVCGTKREKFAVVK